MTKEEHIGFWKESAHDDWQTACYNLDGKKMLPALFFFHLTIEKLLKALWVKHNVGNTPPFTHDLVTLYQQLDLEMPAEWYDYLNTINRWNIEGRYPDYKRKLHALAGDAYMNHHFQQVGELRQWLLSKT